MSNSVQPQKRQPTRLCRPWDSPGKNTGVGCHFLLQCMKWKVKVKSLSRVQLFATPWTAAYQAPPSMGFSKQEYWSGVPSPSLALALEPVNWALKQLSWDLRLEHFCSVLLFLYPLELSCFRLGGNHKDQAFNSYQLSFFCNKRKNNVDKDKNLPLTQVSWVYSLQR